MATRIIQIFIEVLSLSSSIMTPVELERGPSMISTTDSDRSAMKVSMVSRRSSTTTSTLTDRLVWPEVKVIAVEGTEM